MPYKIVGKTVYSKSSGKWKKKQTCTSVANAKAAMRLLYGIEGGMVPRSKGKGRSKGKSKKRKK